MNKENLAGLYIHVPFCLSKCPYCDFYSETSLSLIKPWLAALEQEMRFYRKKFPLFDTLYVGGGTPTALDNDVFFDLFERVQQIFHFTPDAEITVEANPNDVNSSKLHVLKSCGVNRISLGVQSFNDRALLFLKRRHTVDEVEKSLELIREEGFNNVSFDLIYGIPGQTLAGWMKTLERAVSFHPQHLSCYQLTLSEETKLGKMRKKGLIKLPGETETESFFVSMAEYLEGNGYLHYEVSNFALGEQMTSRHNQKYWRHASYLGLGPSAHSFQHGRRWWNQRSVVRYNRAIENGVMPVSGEEMLTAEQLRIESLFLGLRTCNGFECSDFEEKDGFRKQLERLLEEGYVRVSGRWIMPTRKGFLVADRLPLLFL